MSSDLYWYPLQIEFKRSVTGEKAPCELLTVLTLTDLNSDLYISRSNCQLDFLSFFSFLFFYFHFFGGQTPRAQ